MPLEAGFVKSTQAGFVTGGNPLPVAGLNCYFLAYCSDRSRQVVLEAAKVMGANVLRCWAFLGVEDRRQNPVAFQYLDNGSIAVDTGPDGLERLDALIAAAEANGLRLILPLVNYWKDFGGMPLYLKWLGISGGVEEFYRSPAARSAYRDWVRTVATRRNTRTNRFYYEEPAVMAWELANEPRCEVSGGRELLLDWIGDMSRFLKSLDPNHLLAVGDEGFLRHASTKDDLYDGRHGVDGEAILNFGEIDFGTFHFYPESMNRPPDFAETWIRDHVESGARASKPMLMEEYGIKSDGFAASSVLLRNKTYAAWLENARRFRLAGSLLWMCGCKEPDTAGFRDDYTVYSAAEIPALAAHAIAMQTAPPPSSRGLDGDNERVVISLRTVEGGAIPDPVSVTFQRSGQATHVTQDSPDSFLVPTNISGAWSIDITSPRYRPLQSGFFLPIGGNVRAVSPTALRDPSQWTASFQEWAQLGPSFESLRKVLSGSGDVSLFQTGVNLGHLTDAAYDNLGAPDERIAKTALLNLYCKLMDLVDPLHTERPWFSYIQTLLEIGRERIIAKAEPGIAQSVRTMLGNPANLPYKPAEDAEGHRRNLPPEFQAKAEMFSIKATVVEASLQLTVAVIPDLDFVLLDADIDEHGVLLLHFFDWIGHAFTGGTHPYDIHEFLVAQATGQGRTLDLGYQLV